MPTLLPPDAPELILRPATVEDLPGIMVIERGSFAAPWPEACIRDEIDGPDCAKMILAQHDRQIVGFMNYWHVEDERHVLNFAVHPEFRRRGIGRAMLLHLLALARAEDVRLLLLEVRASNLSARKLYESIGFFDYDVRRRYYSDNGEDAIVMICQLNNL